MIKNQLYVLLLVLIAAGCAKQHEQSSTNENVKVVRSMFDVFNKHDWKAMADHYIDSASFLDPSFGKEYVIKRKTDIVYKYSEMNAICRDIHDEIVDLYPSGDKVIVEFISTGTLPDGSKFSLPISSILTVKEGKIIKDATYYDQEDQ